MAKFVTGGELNLALENLFATSKKQLVLISPYVKLHPRLIDILKKRKSDHTLKILMVFGKNDDDISKSMAEDDFRFLTKFPNIEIRYENRLHAKFYANDKSAIFSSMNLYSFSQENNIEFGILTSTSVLGNIAGKLISKTMGKVTWDHHAFLYFSKVFLNSEILFKKTPVYKSKFLNLGKKYIDSRIDVDNLSRFFELRIPIRANHVKKLGYCIRTRKMIPFNIQKPMCDDAFNNWKKYGNEDFAERYCHFSGEESFGQTSMARPILYKYWDEAKFVYDF